ncbi:hypothetical protein WS72_02445 [Burkholderia savannae]|uniref:Uncharacterized protein n=1 Tax=Burkholderia savannae TaxID=1637837 RepID=A0ABR5TAC0_9BURK|nr:hypothetical protein WS72_02445 [Burkholderia savannae]
MAGMRGDPFPRAVRPRAVFASARRARRTAPAALGRGRACPPQAGETAVAAANRLPGATSCRAFLKSDPETVRK